MTTTPSSTINLGKVRGTELLSSDTRERYREPEEIEFLETISQYVTVAYERLRMIEQLRVQDRSKNEFLATLAHELRNPLAPVRNAIQILHSKGLTVSELHWARAVIDRQIDQMARLVDDLMHLRDVQASRQFHRTLARRPGHWPNAGPTPRRYARR
jgi:signal transduction histidine kinase